jgi:PqqD family protein of HPr-rel-A system
MTARYRAAPTESCLWADCQGDWVLFHRPSGKTHFLNAGTALLLREVLRTPLHAGAAAAELARLQGGSLDARFQSHVADLLRRLEELGLVERIAG